MDSVPAIDTAELISRARRASDLAHTVALLTARVERSADLDWHSPAATLFRAAIGEVAREVGRARRQLEESADVVSRVARGL